MTDFFSSTKTAPIIQKPNQPINVQFKIERIAQQLRGDNVKILWFPKSHYELQPPEYVSVILLNEISRRLDQDDKLSLVEASQQAIDSFPNQAWSMLCQRAADCEKFYDDDKKPSKADAVIKKEGQQQQQEAATRDASDSEDEERRFFRM